MSRRQLCAGHGSVTDAFIFGSDWRQNRDSSQRQAEHVQQVSVSDSSERPM